LDAEQAYPPFGDRRPGERALAVTVAVLLINGSSFAPLSDAQMATIKG
jgi:hypothetical protein